jgi:methionyl-tRNA formyltransferase
MPDTPANIVLFGASTRAISFMNKLIELRPDDRIIVMSFPADPWEPPFFDAVRELTLSSGNEFHEMKAIGPRKWNEVVAGRQIDVLFAVGWRYLIPPTVYESTSKASIVFHNSLLPKYRGFAPSNWAIINGETETGATMFLMSETVDSGPIIDQRSFPIGPDDTIREVEANVTDAYLSLLESNIGGLMSGNFDAAEQDHTQATLTTKRVPADGEIDWSQSSENTHNLVRALADPWPGAFTSLDGRKLMIWSTKRYSGPAPVGSVPGRVIDLSEAPSVTVATGGGAIVVETVQLEDGNVVGATEVITSVSDTLGRG